MFYFVGFTKHIYLTHYSLLCGLTVICNKDFYYIHSLTIIITNFQTIHFTAQTAFKLYVLPQISILHTRLGNKVITCTQKPSKNDYMIRYTFTVATKTIHNYCSLTSSRDSPY